MGAGLTCAPVDDQQTLDEVQHGARDAGPCGTRDVLGPGAPQKKAITNGNRNGAWLLGVNRLKLGYCPN